MDRFLPFSKPHSLKPAHIASLCASPRPCISRGTGWGWLGCWSLGLFLRPWGRSLGWGNLCGWDLPQCHSSGCGRRKGTPRPERRWILFYNTLLFIRFQSMKSVLGLYKYHADILPMRVLHCYLLNGLQY